jgi:hypothetical protein
MGKGEINLYAENVTVSECNGSSSADGLVFQNATRVSSEAYQAGDIGQPGG